MDPSDQSATFRASDLMDALAHWVSGNPEIIVHLTMSKGASSFSSTGQATIILDLQGVRSDATSAWFLQQTATNFAELRANWSGLLTILVPASEKRPALAPEEILEKRKNVCLVRCIPGAARAWPREISRRASPDQRREIAETGTKDKSQALRQFNRRTGLLTARGNWLVGRARRSK